MDNQYQALQTSGNVRLVRRLLPDMQLSGVYEAPSVLYHQVDRLQGDYPVVVNELIPAQLQQSTNVLAGYARGAHAPPLADDPDLDRAVDAIRARRVELLGLARNEAAVATASWFVLARMRSDHEELLEHLAPWDRATQSVAEMLEECGTPRR